MPGVARPGKRHRGRQRSPWTTGYTFGVSLADGFPRFGPEEFTLEAALAAGATDLVVFVATRPTGLSADVLAALRARPTIWIGSEPPPAGLVPAVTIATAGNGLSAGGGVYRFDDVPLDLTPFVRSAVPRDVDVLEAILAHSTWGGMSLEERGAQ